MSSERISPKYVAWDRVPKWSSSHCFHTKMVFLRLWDKDGLSVSLPTFFSPETPRSGDSHRQPTPVGASRLTWETSSSNSLKQAGFKQKAALFFPPDLPDQTALLYPLTYLNDAISFPSLPVLRKSLIWSSRLTLKPSPVKTEISAPCHPLPFHTSSTSSSPLLGWEQGKGDGAK